MVLKQCYPIILRSFKRYTSGSVRQAGGKIAERGKALEDEYFYRKQKEQLAELRQRLTGDVQVHSEQLELYKKVLDNTKKSVKIIEEDEKKLTEQETAVKNGHKKE